MTGAGDESDAGFLDLADGTRLAYRRCGGRAPGVMFLGGFMSDMTGTKATAILAHCRARGQACLLFDYSGHGASSGRFEDGTIGRWAGDAMAALERLTTGAQILVGSSMGGWIMLRVALARPARVRALVGVAAAPDFTDEMLARELPPAARATLEREGRVLLPSAYGDAPYIITRRLIEDGRVQAVLGGPVPLHCPARLLHGMRDESVPWERSLRLADALAGDDVVVTLVKDGDHRLSRDADIRRLLRTIDDLAADQPPGAASPSR